MKSVQNPVKIPEEQTFQVLEDYIANYNKEIRDYESKNNWFKLFRKVQHKPLPTKDLIEYKKKPWYLKMFLIAPESFSIDLSNLTKEQYVKLDTLCKAPKIKPPIIGAAIENEQLKLTSCQKILEGLEELKAQSSKFPSEDDDYLKRVNNKVTELKASYAKKIFEAELTRKWYTAIGILATLALALAAVAVPVVLVAIATTALVYGFKSRRIKKLNKSKGAITQDDAHNALLLDKKIDIHKQITEYNRISPHNKIQPINIKDNIDNAINLLKEKLNTLPANVLPEKPVLPLKRSNTQVDLIETLVSTPLKRQNSGILPEVRAEALQLMSGVVSRPQSENIQSKTNLVRPNNINQVMSSEGTKVMSREGVIVKDAIKSAKEDVKKTTWQQTKSALRWIRDGMLAVGRSGGF